MKYLRQLLGIQLDTTSHLEKFISMLGAFISIFCVLLVTRATLDISLHSTTSLLIITSMGASAVLLFAVPHGPLSQPWPVLGSHLVSGLIGVSCYFLVDDLFIAAALAVSTSIYAMYYLRCIHPPGGATALAAVVSSSEVHALGYQFVFSPVMLNALTILAIAVLFNYPFVWRRYPAALADVFKQPDEGRKHPHHVSIPRKDLEFALKSMRSFADISEIELEKIYEAATRKKQQRHLQVDDIKLGHFYLHGKNDAKGLVRQVISVSNDGLVTYSNLSGSRQGTTATLPIETFARWAKHEVIQTDDGWTIAATNKR
jgi:CBS-domain-containing membrane protein